MDSVMSNKCWVFHNTDFFHGTIKSPLLYLVLLELGVCQASSFAV